MVLHFYLASFLQLHKKIICLDFIYCNHYLYSHNSDLQLDEFPKMDLSLKNHRLSSSQHGTFGVRFLDLKALTHFSIIYSYCTTILLFYFFLTHVSICMGSLWTSYIYIYLTFVMLSVPLWFYLLYTKTIHKTVLIQAIFKVSNIVLTNM